MSMGFSELRPVTNKLGHRQKGAIFGGGGREELIFASDGDVIGTSNHGSETKAVGQFGGGFEVRFTPAIGLMNDFSWNVVAGPKNNFGMVRSGITIAF
jgi:hypothetical protein